MIQAILAFMVNLVMVVNLVIMVNLAIMVNLVIMVISVKLVKVIILVSLVNLVILLLWLHLTNSEVKDLRSSLNSFCASSLSSLYIAFDNC